MISYILTSVENVKKRSVPALSDRILFSEYVRFPLQTWMEQPYRWRPIELPSPTTYDGQQPVLFAITNIDLPTATRRWKVSLPGHPEISFDDLRAGKWPRLTAKELEARDNALELARIVRDKLDIKPLTTVILIRQIREGKEGSD